MKEKRKCWSTEEVQILLDNYEMAETEQEIRDLLPNRTWESIKNKAQDYNLNRVKLRLDNQAMIADFVGGKNYILCMRKYGVSQAEFYRRLKKYNVAVRKLTDFGDDEEFALNYETKKVEWLEEFYKTAYKNIKIHASNLDVRRPEEMILRKVSAVDIALIEYEYIHNNLTADQIAIKYRGQKGYSRENICAICRDYNILKDPAEIQQQKMNTRFERYGSIGEGIYGKTEEKIRDWLNSLGCDFKKTVTVLKGKELDMYDENLKVAIEYCGLRWHSDLLTKQSTSKTENEIIKELANNKIRHDIKRIECESKGIRLITIFEDEWLHRQDQCEGFLLSVVKKNEQRVYGRNCEVREISIKEANVFFESHHIQGANSSGKHAAGLFYEELLVGAMSFGSHPFDGRVKDVYLDRLCFRKNFLIQGGASKLFKFLIEKYPYNEITSWSDNRWSQGNVYVSIGFACVSNQPPDYSYFDSKNLKRLHKATQRKDIVKCPENFTEEEWANQNGKYRIWDCGKKKWKWNKITSTI